MSAFPKDPDAASSEQQKTHNKLEAHLECPICLCLLCEPVTIACGHSFCRVCLVKCFRSKRECVICRAESDIYAEEAKENIALRNICISLYCDVYAQRHAEAQSEKQSWGNILPVFIYNQVSTCGNKQFALCNPPETDTLVGATALVLSVEEALRSADGSFVVTCSVCHPRRKVTSFYVEPHSHGLVYGETIEVRDSALSTAIVPPEELNQLMTDIAIHISECVGAGVTLPLWSVENDDCCRHMYLIAEEFSLRALAACTVHRCVHPSEWNPATAFSDPFGSGFYRCTFVNKRLLVETVNTKFRLEWVLRFLRHDAEQKRKGVLGNLGLVWGYIRTLVSHSDNNLNAGGTSSVAGATIEREESDGWVNIHQIPDEDDANSDHGSDNGLSDSEDEIEFHDASSGDSDGESYQ